MKKLILLLMVLLTLNACATSGVVGAPGTSQAVANAQYAAAKSLYAAATALKVTPDVLAALYNAGKINKEQYNSVVVIYNKALASLNIAISALTASISIGQDPANEQAYIQALQVFLNDKANTDNILTALGKQPVGGLQ